MNYPEDLNQKIYSYYLNYYKNVCCIKNPAKRALFRLNEEANESKRLKRLLDILNLSLQNQRHFIVGTGTGGLAVVLKKEFNCQVYGLEPDPKALSITKTKAELSGLDSNNFKLAPAENIPFPDNSFDFVHCFTVLEHVTNIKKSIQEMIRITKPDGHIYINTPNYNYPYEGHYKTPFPTFLPKTFGYLYLILLGKSPKFLKTINFITPKKIDKILLSLKNISWIRIYESTPRQSGHLGPFFNFFKFELGIYPNQEILITKNASRS